MYQDLTDNHLRNPQVAKLVETIFDIQEIRLNTAPSEYGNTTLSSRFKQQARESIALLDGKEPLPSEYFPHIGLISEAIFYFATVNAGIPCGISSIYNDLYQNIDFFIDKHPVDVTTSCKPEIYKKKFSNYRHPPVLYLPEYREQESILVNIPRQKRSYLALFYHNSFDPRTFLKRTIIINEKFLDRVLIPQSNNTYKGNQRMIGSIAIPNLQINKETIEKQREMLALLSSFLK